MVISLIEEIRGSIDKIDEEILKLLSKRKDLAREVGKLKENLDLPVFDKKREEEILKNIANKAKKLGLDVESAYSIFGSIFQSSRSEQQKNMDKVECSVKNIGLIGFGRFGKLIVSHLSADFKFYVYNRSNEDKEIKQSGAIPASLKEACSQEIVILAVPISEIEDILKNIKNLLRKDTIVIDCCSVKEHPIGLMKKILPKSVQLLGTHSMFGPDSASDSLEGRKIVLCRERIEDKSYSQIKRFLESKKLLVIESTPKEHDMQMAKSLVLTHFIGRALMGMKASNLKIDTKSYRDLIKILDTVRNDTWQLFEDMNKFNKYAKGVRTDFIRSIQKIDKKVK